MPCSYFGSGWKMNGTVAETRSYLGELQQLTANLPNDQFLFVIPPFTALWAAREQLSGSRIRLGAQNMHWEHAGSFTGEISAPMLQEIGIDLIELGHSERRQYFGETDETVNKKVLAALPYGWRVLLCVGETAEEKENGNADAAVINQLQRALQGVPLDRVSQLIVAYEPVWAIGESGKPATIGYAADRLEGLREGLRALFGRYSETVPLLYGGSVRLDNARHFIKNAGFDGLFIGRASWSATGFNDIIQSVTQV